MMVMAGLTIATVPASQHGMAADTDDDNDGIADD